MSQQGPSWSGFKFVPRKELDEQIVDYIYSFQWTNKTFLSSPFAPIVGSALYLLIIYALHVFKKDKPPSGLKLLIILHNLFLVIISAIMFSGTLFEVLRQARGGASIFDLICDPEEKNSQGAIYFWSYMFYLSKYYEFLDTVFIVLKKRELTFLHIFHHCFTVWLCWCGMATKTTNQFVGVLLNTFVHVCMYYYYLRAALGQTSWWKKYLTTMQMVQFWIVMASLLLWLYLDRTNQPVGCAGELWSWGACFFAQVSFFLLFQNFYKHTYAGKKDH